MITIFKYFILLGKPYRFKQILSDAKQRFFVLPFHLRLRGSPFGPSERAFCPFQLCFFRGFRLFYVGENDQEDKEENEHRNAARNKSFDEIVDGRIPTPQIAHEGHDDAPKRTREERNADPADEVPHRLPPRIPVRTVGDVPLQRQVDALRGEHSDFIAVLPYAFAGLAQPRRNELRGKIADWTNNDR